jgi:GcrA cell cycle regulator
MSLNQFDSEWTQERIELLKQLWTEGHSASQIANKFRGTAFTRCAVIGKARRLKLEPRAPRQPVRRKARRQANGVPKPPMPPPRPRPPPPPPPLVPRMRKLTFFRLKPGHCRWPLGDWFAPARLFCAADKDATEIYCPFHRRMARRCGDA